MVLLCFTLFHLGNGRGVEGFFQGFGTISKGLVCKKSENFVVGLSCLGLQDPSHMSSNVTSC